MNQVADGVPGLPLMLACKVTSPLAGIVTDIGETATVTLFGLDPLAPPPHAAIAINEISAPIERVLYESIPDLFQQELQAVTPVAVALGGRMRDVIFHHAEASNRTIER